MQTHKKSEMEKRLQVLRQQLYSQPSKSVEEIKVTSNNKTAVVSEDQLYLKQDLTKIIILSSLALAIQFLLFLSVHSKVINLPFML